MRREVAMVFDGSFDGFLCVIYDFYYAGIAPISIELSDEYQQTLDGEVHRTATVEAHARRVQQGIREKISDDALVYLGWAFLCETHADVKFMALFQYILMGFKRGAAVDDHLQHDAVHLTHKMARAVTREAHLLTGFARFARTEPHGVFYCEISPKNNVLPLLVEHFTSRMLGQAWVIHDKKRNEAAVFDGRDYVMVLVPQDTKPPQFSEGEAEIEAMWVEFFHTIAIKERENPKLQRNMLPLHFRKNMVEFKI